MEENSLRLLKATNMKKPIQKALLSLFDQALADNGHKTLDLLEKSAGSFLLDCGCSEGEKTLQFVEKIGTTNIYGIDIDSNALKKAEQNGIKTCCCDLNKSFPFKNQSFDIVVSYFVIEDLVFLDNFAKEIFRVLKSGGFAVITTENLSSWHNIFALVLGYQDFTIHTSNVVHIGNPLSPHYKEKCEKGSPTGHVRCLTYQSLKELFELYGFTVEKIVGSGYYPFPRILSSILSLLDTKHTHFITIKIRKNKYSPASTD